MVQAAYASPAAERPWADHQILDHFYGHLPPEPRRTPMRELISTRSLAPHHPRRRRAGLRPDAGSLRRLARRAGAPTAELAHAIRTTRWPDTQAPRIQEILRRIQGRNRRCAFDLDFLADWPAERGHGLAHRHARHWPENGLAGAALQLPQARAARGCARAPRGAARGRSRAQGVGGEGPRCAAGPAAGWMPKRLFNFHKHNYWHGQQICFFLKPNCPRCPLKGFCNYY
ncbi:MAG: endonuclease III [Hymenobacter sp.]